jgi:hypothetical protein
MRNKVSSEKLTSSTRDWLCTVMDWGAGAPDFKPALETVIKPPVREIKKLADLLNQNQR